MSEKVSEHCDKGLSQARSQYDREGCTQIVIHHNSFASILMGTDPSGLLEMDQFYPNSSQFRARNAISTGYPNVAGGSQ